MEISYIDGKMKVAENSVKVKGEGKGKVMSKVCVFFGTGYEEIEALTVVDLLRRENIDTETVSVMESKTVTGSHQIPVIMDKLIEEVDFSEVDMIVLPGGMPGTKNLEGCSLLMEQVDAFVAEGKPVCAICAAPSILGHRGHLKGREAIAYPGFEDQLAGAKISNRSVVKDGNIITGQGMGAAVEFGLAIVEYWKGQDVRNALAEKIVFK